MGCTPVFPPDNSWRATGVAFVRCRLRLPQERGALRHAFYALRETASFFREATPLVATLAQPPGALLRNGEALLEQGQFAANAQRVVM